MTAAPNSLASASSIASDDADPAKSIASHLHRTRVKHYEVPRQARMFTFSCYHRLTLLLDDRRRLILAHSLTAAAARHHWLLLAFVFMPEHVHIVTVPWDDASDSSALLYAIKRPASSRLKHAMTQARDPLLSELTIRERPGKHTFRFWQEGPGHDRNIRDEDPSKRRTLRDPPADKPPVAQPGRDQCRQPKAGGHQSHPIPACCEVFVPALFRTAGPRGILWVEAPPCSYPDCSRRVWLSHSWPKAPPTSSISARWNSTAKPR